MTDSSPKPSTEDATPASAVPDNVEDEPTKSTTDTDAMEIDKTVPATATADAEDGEASNSEDVQMTEVEPLQDKVDAENNDNDEDNNDNDNEDINTPDDKAHEGDEEDEGTTTANADADAAEEDEDNDMENNILDGTLDDGDTEDTEPGNGNDDFSYDEDLDGDLDDRLLDSSDRVGPDDEMTEANGLHNSSSSGGRDSKKGHENDDGDDQDETNGKDAPVHSEDSDSDLAEPDASGNEGDDEPDTKVKEKSNTSLHPAKLQKPPTTDEPKEAWDDMSDELSDLEDTDDSDDDDDERISQPSASPVPVPSKESAKPSLIVKPTLNTRKRYAQELEEDNGNDTGHEASEQETDTKDTPSVKRNGRTDSPKRVRKETGGSHSSTKDSESEEPEEEEEEEGEEEEEEEEQAVGEEEEGEEEEEEEEEDLESKQRHQDALEELTNIEVEFANLRDKMYEERMTELDQEVEMIHSGSHPELSSLMREIEQKREQRLEVAKAWKKYRCDIARCQAEAAEYLAHCTFQSKRRNIRSESARALGQKQRQLSYELSLTSNAARFPEVDKATLTRERRHKKVEAIEYRITKQYYGFPVSSKLTPINHVELEDDFHAMGLARHLPPVHPPVEEVDARGYNTAKNGPSSQVVSGLSIAASANPRTNNLNQHQVQHRQQHQPSHQPPPHHLPPQMQQPQHSHHSHQQHQQQQQPPQHVHHQPQQHSQHQMHQGPPHQQHQPQQHGQPQQQHHHSQSHSHHQPPPPHQQQQQQQQPQHHSGNHRWSNGGGMDHSTNPGKGNQGQYWPRNAPPPPQQSEVEILIEGNECKVDGQWYRPNDPVSVLDASHGRYNAKFMYLANEEIMLQKTDGSKTRLHLNLFRGRKLCMQPRVL